MGHERRHVNRSFSAQVLADKRVWLLGAKGCPNSENVSVSSFDVAPKKGYSVEDILPSVRVVRKDEIFHRRLDIHRETVTVTDYERVQR